MERSGRGLIGETLSPHSTGSEPGTFRARSKESWPLNRKFRALRIDTGLSETSISRVHSVITQKTVIWNSLTTEILCWLWISTPCYQTQRCVVGLNWFSDKMFPPFPRFLPLSHPHSDVISFFCVIFGSITDWWLHRWRCISCRVMCFQSLAVQTNLTPDMSIIIRITKW